VSDLGLGQRVLGHRAGRSRSPYCILRCPVQPVANQSKSVAKSFWTTTKSEEHEEEEEDGENDC
jgi:hypothetical protein